MLRGLYMFKTILRLVPTPSRQARQKSLPAETVNSSSGNSLTLCLGSTVFGSQQPRQDERRLPLGGGLVWTRRLRDSSDTGRATGNDVTVPVESVDGVVEVPLGTGSAALSSWSADSALLIVESDEVN